MVIVLLFVSGCAASSLALRQGWLVSLIFWQEHVDEIRRAVHVAVRENDYAAKVAASRAKWVTVEELAGVLAGADSVWVLCEPLPEELDEMREFVREVS